MILLVVIPDRFDINECVNKLENEKFFEYLGVDLNSIEDKEYFKENIINGLKKLKSTEVIRESDYPYDSWREIEEILLINKFVISLIDLDKHKTEDDYIIINIGVYSEEILRILGEI